MHRLASSSVLLLGAALASASCSSKNQPPSGPATSCQQGKLLIDGQCVAPTAAWTEIKPGGTTTCLRGDPYSFFVHLGTSNKLLIYFAFGGFCYDAQLCAVGAVNCVPKVNVDTNSLASTSGILDLNRPDNPFKDWSWVYVPECTADFEWGDNVANYPATGGSPAITVHHNGFVNVTAVRDWVYENFTSPDRIFVSGSSGGADAALLHYSYIRQHYANVTNWAYLADSSFGVVTDQFLSTDINSWKAFDHRPMWIPAIASTPQPQQSWDFSEIQVSQYYKNGTLAEFGTAYDTLETISYEIMGGTKSDWHAKMDAHLQNVSGQTPNFRYLIAPGTAHIVLNQGTFYQYQVNGTSLRDWVASLANGQDVTNDQCTSNCMVAPQLPAADGGGAGVVETQILCLGSSECSQGELCCGSAASKSASCVSGASCPPGSLQLCIDKSDCSSNTCSQFPVQGATLGVCQ
jgi:hypothetical protein